MLLAYAEISTSSAALPARNLLIFFQTFEQPREIKHAMNYPALSGLHGTIHLYNFQNHPPSKKKKLNLGNNDLNARPPAFHCLLKLGLPESEADSPRWPTPLPFELLSSNLGVIVVETLFYFLRKKKRERGERVT